MTRNRWELCFWCPAAASRAAHLSLRHPHSLISTGSWAATPRPTPAQGPSSRQGSSRHTRQRPAAQLPVLSHSQLTATLRPKTLPHFLLPSRVSSRAKSPRFQPRSSRQRLLPKQHPEFPRDGSTRHPARSRSPPSRAPPQRPFRCRVSGSLGNRIVSSLQAQSQDILATWFSVLFCVSQDQSAFPESSWAAVQSHEQLLRSYPTPKKGPFLLIP